MHHDSQPPGTPVAGARVAGIAIALATLLSTVFVALDESGGGQGQREILNSIAQLQGLKAVVHGVAIASLCAYGFGFAMLARRLSLNRPAVLAGLACYLMGCVALVGATIVDGFVIPHLAADAVMGSATRLQVGYEFVHAAGIALTDAARVGWVLQAVGALGWAGTLLAEGGLGRLVGALGGLANLAVVAAVVAAGSSVTLPAILTVMLAQLVWNLLAAFWLARDGRRTATGTTGSRMSGLIGA